MKELETPLTQKPETQIVTQVKQQKEFKKLGSESYHLGHICFEYNTVTGEIVQAKYKKMDIHWNEATNLREKVKSLIVNPDCIYRTALNAANVIKKLKQEGYTNFK